MKDKKPVHGDFWKIKGGKVSYTHVVSCGQDHLNIEFKAMERPVVMNENDFVWTMWAPCPTNGDPILMSVLVAGGDDDAGNTN